MFSEFPSFKSPFLNAFCEAFSRRRKSISHKGALSNRFECGNVECEWLEVSFKTAQYPIAILQLIENNTLHFYIRDNSRTKRGKVLLSIEDLLIYSNAESILSEFVDIIDKLWLLHGDKDTTLLCQEIKDQLGKLALRRIT